MTAIAHLNRQGKRGRSALSSGPLNTTSPFNIWVTEMIYISAVGMINALGDNCDEIAA